MGKCKKRAKNNYSSTALDQQTFLYYENVAKAINNELEFDSNENRVSCINAVLKTLSEEGLMVSQDQTVSTIVEDVLRFANRDQLRAILKNFSQDWELACCDRSASFVTQSLLLHLNKYLGDEGSDGDEKSLEELLDELFLFMKSNVAFYMQHVSASHVLRVLIEAFTGCQVSDMVIRGKNLLRKGSEKVLLKRPPAEYQKKVTEISTCVINLPKLDNHVRNNLSNPVLQTILLSLKAIDAETFSSLCCQMISKAQVFNTSSNNELPENLTHEIGSHLVEQLLATMPDDIFQSTWETYFRKKLLVIAKHPVANFVLQKLISQAKSDQQFEEIFEELSHDFESLMALNHFGIIVALTESCVRHPSLQAKLIQSLQMAFHCHSPAERQCKLVPLLMTLMTYEMFYQLESHKKSLNIDGVASESTDDVKSEDKVAVGKVTSVNFHGSLIIQNLLEFTGNLPIVNSFFELKSMELKAVCCNACGSHVIETFLKTTKEKRQEMLYDKIKSVFVDLACNKYGSRTFDALWKHATVNWKFVIAEELAKHEARLKGNHFGKFIYSKCQIAHFKLKPSCWKLNQENQVKLAKKRKHKAESTEVLEAKATKKQR